MSEKSEKYRFQRFKFLLYHMLIPISAVLFFTETVFGGLGLEGAGLGIGAAGLGLGLGLGTLALTTRLGISLICFADINECNEGKCPEHSTCKNTDGSYKCDCESGYEFHEQKCVG